MPLRQRKLWPEQRTPCLQGLAVPAAADMVDCQCRLTARGLQQFARATLDRVIHAATDRRSQSGRVWPFIENPVSEGRKQALQLIVKSTLPPAVEAFECHHLVQERRLDRLLAMAGIVVPILD